MQTACCPVEMTKVRDDPYVHFGDVVQLLHVNTGCLLAIDVEDKVRAVASAAATAAALKSRS
jgi:hypothetical protein